MYCLLLCVFLDYALAVSTLALLSCKRLHAYSSGKMPCPKKILVITVTMTTLLSSSASQDLRRKAARMLAAKSALAARVDSFHESIDGKVGDDLRTEVEGKFDKWQEPPPVKTVKPLPAPIDQARKKRGGRRFVCAVL